MTMEIARAQADVRRIYFGGWGGPAVSAVVWLVAAITTDFVGTSTGAVVLFVGGALLIFPTTVLLNRLVGGQADLPAGHPMRGLAMQTAATMAVTLLALVLLSTTLAGAFFPLAMIVVGTHYFPFTHLYGEPAFLVGGAVQTVVGFVLLLGETRDSLGAYVMAGLLLALSVALVVRHRGRVRAAQGPPARTSA